MEPGKWVKTGGGVWVAKTDDKMSFKMVLRMSNGAIYAAVQEDDGLTISSCQSFGGFASVKDAKAWCDDQWARHYSAPSKVRSIERRIAVLQDELTIARQREATDA
jgi:hypothetical protein